MRRGQQPEEALSGGTSLPRIPEYSLAEAPVAGEYQQISMPQQPAQADLPLRPPSTVKRSGPSIINGVLSKQDHHKSVLSIVMAPQTCANDLVACLTDIAYFLMVPGNLPSHLRTIVGSSSCCNIIIMLKHRQCPNITCCRLCVLLVLQPSQQQSVSASRVTSFTKHAVQPLMFSRS